jgi:hypothetical protein
MSGNGWIGVDLDGTLAYYDGWKGEDVIGDPVPLMANRVKEWIEDGKTIKIFTARATTETGKVFVEEWLKKWGFPPLEVTNVKDFKMARLYDDRAVQVEENTGILYRFK